MERKVNVGIAVAVLRIHNDNYEILLGKRKGSHGAGKWSFPGGWMRHGEHFFDTARRELAEETDMTSLSLLPDPIHVSTTIWEEEDVQSVTVVMAALDCTETPKVMEPHKLDGEWTWFQLDQLPKPLFEPLANDPYLWVKINNLDW